MIGRLKLYAIIIGLSVLSALLFGRSFAVRKELKRALAANKNQKEMRDAAANVRTDSNSLIDRLRKGKF